MTKQERQQNDLEYINSTYSTNYKIGSRVKFEDTLGTIIDTHNQYIVVQLEWRKVKGNYHPTWHIEEVTTG